MRSRSKAFAFKSKALAATAPTLARGVSFLCGWISGGRRGFAVIPRVANGALAYCAAYSPQAHSYSPRDMTTNSTTPGEPVSKKKDNATWCRPTAQYSAAAKGVDLSTATEVATVDVELPENDEVWPMGAAIPDHYKVGIKIYKIPPPKPASGEEKATAEGGL